MAENRPQQFDYFRNLPKHFENTILSRKFIGRPVLDNNPQLSVLITTIAMPEEKKRAASIIKEASEKVAYTVATFSSDERVFQLPATKTKPKKVTIMVGTFLKGDRDGFQY